ncbi:MAG: helix-turn-helix domain-containing protein [Parvibaculaceae bacterium]
MSVKVSEMVRLKRFSSHTQKAVARAMADYAADDGSKIFPSVGTLAADVQLTDRAVRLALVELRQSGLVQVVKKGGGRNLSTQYRIDLQALDRLPNAKDAIINPERRSPFNGENPERHSINPERRSPDPSLSVKKDKRTDLETLPVPPARSAPNGAGAAAPSVNAEIWKEGLALLMTNGLPEARSRTMIGQWCKRAESEEQKTQLRAAIRSAVKAGTGDPLAYVNKVLGEIAPPPPDPAKFNADDWRRCVQAIIRRGEWPPELGARPESGRCIMPSEFFSPELMAAISLRKAA